MFRARAGLRPDRRPAHLPLPVLRRGATRAARPALLRLAAPIHTAFLGDSYTFGIGATEPTDGYAYLVSRAEKWTSRIVGLPGSGYVRVATRDDKNIAAGLSTVIAAQPQVVIVASGHNDAMPNVAYKQTEAAALKDLGRCGPRCQRPRSSSSVRSG